MFLLSKKDPFISVLLFVDMVISSGAFLSKLSNKKPTPLEKTLFTMIENCNLGLENIILYHTNSSELISSLLTVESSMSPRSWILSSKFGRIGDFSTILGDPAVINGYVVVLDLESNWKQLLENMIYSWKCTKSCKVIIVSKLPNSCHHKQLFLQILGYTNYDVHYVCVDEKYGPRVYTQDRYGDSRPLGWRKLSWKIKSEHPWSFYVRQYNADFCHGFSFNHTIPTDVRVVVGIFKEVTNEVQLKSGFFYTKKTADLVREKVVLERQQFLEKLLKTEFKFYIQPRLIGDNFFDVVLRSFTSTSIDMLSDVHGLSSILFFSPSFPIIYEFCVIVSHQSRLATPLEKISRFYGIWTLVSLMAILGLTFVVIYFKIDRNVSSTGFKVLKLLTNFGIKAPIKTLSLKIFFCMVFLYFLVIHATLSGNLQKFLTIPEAYKRVETLEDLADPQITTVYNEGCIYDDADLTGKIMTKIKRSHNLSDTFNKFLKDRDSVFITIKTPVQFLIHDLNLRSEVYVSKHDVKSIIGAYVFRNRFFFQEEFNRAMIYSFDVAVDRQFHEKHRIVEWNTNKQLARSEIRFKNIPINELKFAFTLLCVGNTMGLICFFFEVIVSKRCHLKVSLRNLKNRMILSSGKMRINVQKIFVEPKPSTE